MNIYKITLLALLATIAVVGRIATGYIPNFQPVTSVIIIGGLYLGPIAGIILALLITFITNMVFGTGIWTIWQIVSWGLIGVISGLIGMKVKKVPFFVLIILSIFSGYLFGFIMSLTSYQITGHSFLAYYLVGLPFDTSHAIGNALFMILLYPVVARVFERYIKIHLSD
ncbi:ECF transporter S component [Ornithinibacillus halotolerans]|uniref:ECF transporter S component n=1 Tax=Ornithinibacillus halotolerans TaxID=1274357 RepID=A0A916W1Z9_9BACI|nr:ECF transporter S component [Ornithinibacillus halotolerans]GGA61054.1 hypothetical protein GCM10008025_01310 [Ornithinibacillus halotolerans]